MSDRTKALLLSAAEALRDGRDPFALPFLQEHSVSLDECFEMGDQIAEAIVGWQAINHAARQLHAMRSPRPVAASDGKVE